MDKLEEIRLMIKDLCDSRCYVKGSRCGHCVLSRIAGIIERKEP